MLTGNYGFFNLLTCVLIINLLDDACLEPFLRYDAANESKGKGSRYAAVLVLGL